MDHVAGVTEGPLVATHSNAHAICPCPRNLTDRQLDLIAERDGMVGLNFATSFLDPAGPTHAFEGWDPVLRHLDHLISRLGEDHVGLGSDFDGATIPLSIGDAAGLQHLAGALAAYDYDRPLVEKLFFRNWLAVLARIWLGQKGKRRQDPALTAGGSLPVPRQAISTGLKFGHRQALSGASRLLSQNVMVMDVPKEQKTAGRASTVGRTGQIA